MDIDFDKVATLLDVLIKTKDLPNLLKINQEAMVQLTKLVHEAEEEEQEEKGPPPPQTPQYQTRREL
jgi:hypothetical protein